MRTTHKLAIAIAVVAGAVLLYRRLATTGSVDDATTEGATSDATTAEETTTDATTTPATADATGD